MVTGDLGWVREMRDIGERLDSIEWQPVRVRWSIRRLPFLHVVPIFYMLSAGYRREVRRDRVDLYVFDAEPEVGDKPHVVIPMQRAVEVEQIPQGSTALAAGELHPGHAVFLKVGSTVYWPAGQTNRPSLFAPKWPANE